MDQLSLSEAELPELHLRAVTGVLREIFGLDQIAGVPAEVHLRQLYGAMPPAVRLLACHEEPFDVAYDLSGRPEADRMAFFAASEPAYSTLLRLLEQPEPENRFSPAIGKL